MFVVFGQIKAIFVNKNTVNNTDCLLLAFWLLIFVPGVPEQYTDLLQPCSNFFLLPGRVGTQILLYFLGIDMGPVSAHSQTGANGPSGHKPASVS